MISNIFKEKEKVSNARKIGTADESAGTSCSHKQTTKVKKTNKRKKVVNSDVSSSDELSEIDSSESDYSEITKKRKTDLSACFLLEKDKPEHVLEVFGKMQETSDISKHAAIDVSDRVIRLLKGAKSVKDNFFDKVELKINDAFTENLVNHINLKLKFREVPDNLFTVKFLGRAKRSYFHYKESALICRKNLASLVALDQLVIKNSSMEKVLYETQYTSMISCLNLLKRNIYEFRSALVPSQFSIQLKRKLIYADLTSDSFWHIPSVVKKEIIEASKKSERFFTKGKFGQRGNFNQRGLQFFRGQRGNRRNFRGKQFVPASSSKN